MKQELILVKIDTKYCDYLRQFDDKVPYNYGKKESRPFIGVLFRVDKYMYFAPLSSPKPKHLKMKSQLDFLRLDRVLPVANKNITKIDLDKECLTKLEEKYIKLLKEQLFWLNRNRKKIYGKSKKVYDKYLDKTLDYNIIKRCCNFKLLEEKCDEYNN